MRSGTSAEGLKVTVLLGATLVLAVAGRLSGAGPAAQEAQAVAMSERSVGL